MTDHDVLCPAERENWDDGQPFASPGECQCYLIARVREEYVAWVQPRESVQRRLAAERERIARAIEAERGSTPGDARNRALDDAVAIIRGLQP